MRIELNSRSYEKIEEGLICLNLVKNPGKKLDIFGIFWGQNDAILILFIFFFIKKKLILSTYDLSLVLDRVLKL
jgi:hypothetical protein